MILKIGPQVFRGDWQENGRRTLDEEGGPTTSEYRGQGCLVRGPWDLAKTAGQMGMAVTDCHPASSHSTLCDHTLRTDYKNTLTPDPKGAISTLGRGIFRPSPAVLFNSSSQSRRHREKVA